MKSQNETTGMVFKYPVVYGRKNGNSIWIEKEISDMLAAWRLVEKAGSWFTFTESFFNITKDVIVPPLETKATKAQEEEFSTMDRKDVPFPAKVQGLNAIFEELEARPELTECLRKFFVEALSK